MADPDEAVKPVEKVESKLVAEAQVRHEQATNSELATEQEKRQAAVEQAHALSTRPDGSYAQLHETTEPTLAVADKAAKSQMSKEVAEAGQVVLGEKSAEESEASRAPADSEPVESVSDGPVKASRPAGSAK